MSRVLWGHLAGARVGKKEVSQTLRWHPADGATGATVALIYFICAGVFDR